jgi:hypothetical protein
MSNLYMAGVDPVNDYPEVHLFQPLPEGFKRVRYKAENFSLDLFKSAIPDFLYDKYGNHINPRRIKLMTGRGGYKKVQHIIKNKNIINRLHRYGKKRLLKTARNIIVDTGCFNEFATIDQFLKLWSETAIAIFPFAGTSTSSDNQEKNAGKSLGYYKGAKSRASRLLGRKRRTRRDVGRSKR